jgi:HAD superfamily hydrolase (TIGR01509 family)
LTAVIFDMDGTLVDSLDIVAQAYGTTVLELSGRTCTLEEVLAAFSVGPVRPMLRTLLGRPETEGDLLAYHRNLAQASSNLRAYAGIPEALAYLGERLPLGLFTGAGREATEFVLRTTGLRDLLTVVISGDEVPRPKPAPDGVLAVCRSLGVAPGAAAYVGDAPNDLLAARAAGVLGVAAGWGAQYVADIPADLVLPTPQALVRLSPP